MTEGLKVGDEAPDFSLASTLKSKISLSDFRGKKNVVVAFYPLDFTPGWIKEITSWKEDYKKFEEVNAELLAISVDHIYAHNVFAASLGTLPYPLLSDWHQETVRSYSVRDEEKETAIRSVFIVDKDGVLRFKNTSFDARKKEHYDEVFKELAKLN